MIIARLIDALALIQRSFLGPAKTNITSTSQFFCACL
jgi:hypothetical protein